MVGNKSTTTVNKTLTDILANAIKIEDNAIVVLTFCEKYINIAAQPEPKPKVLNKFFLPKIFIKLPATTYPQIDMKATIIEFV